jgi:hypothetical protein
LNGIKSIDQSIGWVMAGGEIDDEDGRALFGRPNSIFGL